MKTKFLAIIMFILVSTCVILPTAEADTLVKGDFLQQSFSKTVDFFDYARAYAALNDLEAPSADSHAYVYLNYINTSGLQLFYAGLDNITYGGPTTFTIPMQSLIMHFKTENSTSDVLLAQTFLMLLAFNQSSNTIYVNSPNVNDTLWASFSMGFDLASLNATLPTLSSTTETTPLTHSADGLTWTWGMEYTNLTAFWWRMWIDPQDPHFDNSSPVAITVYDELAFNYTLTIDPTTHTATLTESHVIGRIRDLLLRIAPLVWVHYNSTGTYWMGNQLSNDTVYDFIQNNQIKMSIVSYQTSIVANHQTYSAASNGQNVTNTDDSLANASIGTYTDEGEEISEANFAATQTYKLFNYTEDPTEQTYTLNEATVRTAQATGFAQNTGLFALHMALMKYLPLIVAHMFPRLYTEAEETLTNMSRADYFYIIGYGNYSGYRIENDPTLTIYLTTQATSASTPPNGGAIIIIVAAAAIIIVAAALLMRRRKPRTTDNTNPTPS